MKKLILSITAILLFSASASAVSSIPSDTNKTDNSGKKIGFWKEKLNQEDYYGTYSNWKKEGLWIGYYANGIISSIDEYKNDKKNGYSISIDKSGFYNQKEYYINDTVNGLSVAYYPGSKLRSEIEYKMGVLNGIKRIYYSDG